MSQYEIVKNMYFVHLPDRIPFEIEAVSLEIIDGAAILRGEHSVLGAYKEYLAVGLCQETALKGNSFISKEAFIDIDKINEFVDQLVSSSGTQPTIYLHRCDINILCDLGGHLAGLDSLYRGANIRTINI